MVLDPTISVLPWWITLLPQDLERMYEEHVKGMEPTECEVLYGRAGYLASLLFVAKHTGLPPNKEIVQVRTSVW